MSSKIEDVPGIGVSYSVQVGDGKNVVFQTAVERDDTDGLLNKLVDKFQAAAERAVIYSKIENAEFEIERNEALIRTLEVNLDQQAQKYHDRARAANDAGRSKPVIPSGELQAKENAEKTLAAHKEDLDKWQAKLAKFKAKLEG